MQMGWLLTPPGGEKAPPFTQIWRRRRQPQPRQTQRQRNSTWRRLNGNAGKVERSTTLNLDGSRDRQREGVRADLEMEWKLRDRESVHMEMAMQRERKRKTEECRGEWEDERKGGGWLVGWSLLTRHSLLVTFPCSLCFPLLDSMVKFSNYVHKLVGYD